MCSSSFQDHKQMIMCKIISGEPLLSFVQNTFHELLRNYSQHNNNKYIKESPEQHPHLIYVCQNLHSLCKRSNTRETWSV